MSLFSAFTGASKETAPKSEGAPPQPSQGAQSKPVEVAQASLAHPQHHEGATDLDLYRTFSPSDVGFWTLDRSVDGAGSGRGFWGKLFSSNSNK